ncbi:MAG: hypothetical protein ACK5JO_08725 [Halodesulfovibrio sp.]
MITSNQEPETVQMPHDMLVTTESGEADADMAAPEHTAELTEENGEQAEEFVVIYRYLEAESGKEIAAETVVWDEPELSDGAVVHVVSAEGAKQHYTVDRMSGEETVTVYLKKARNTLWRLAVLGILLAGCWFAIDFIVGKIF